MDASGAGHNKGITDLRAYDANLNHLLPSRIHALVKNFCIAGAHVKPAK